MASGGAPVGIIRVNRLLLGYTDRVLYYCLIKDGNMKGNEVQAYVEK